MLRRRRLKASAVAVLAAWALVGCTSGGGVSTATPTPTVLTEDEAYAAAEDAFRAYIDAQNQVVVDDPSTFEPVYALTTGRQNAFDREQYSVWHAEHWQRSGSVEVLWIDAIPSESNSANVRMEVCLDTANARVSDGSGNVIRIQDGLDVAAWTSIIQQSEDDGLWRVEVNALPEGSELCQAR